MRYLMVNITLIPVTEICLRMQYYLIFYNCARQNANAKAELTLFIANPDES